MADFVYFGCACETAFAKQGAFLAALATRTADAVEDVIDANPVAKAVAAFMHPRKVWRGTATQLLMETHGARPFRVDTFGLTGLAKGQHPLQ